MIRKNSKYACALLALALTMSGCASSNEASDAVTEQVHDIGAFELLTETYLVATEKLEINVEMPYVRSGTGRNENLTRIIQKPFKDEINRMHVDGDYFAVKDSSAVPKKLIGKFTVLYEDDTILSLQPEFKDGYWKPPVTVNKKLNTEINFDNLPREDSFWSHVEKAFVDVGVELAPSKEREQFYGDFYITKDAICFTLAPWYSGGDSEKKIVIPFKVLEISRADLLTANKTSAEVMSTQKLISEPYYTFAGEIPSVITPSNPEIGEKISEHLERQIVMNEVLIQDDAKIIYDANKEAGFVYPPDIHNVMFDVKRNDDKYLSIYTIYYAYTGGAHGNHYDMAYIFDMETGDRVQLSDLFEKETDYVSILNKFIKKDIEGIQQEYLQSNKDSTWMPYLGFSTIAKDQHFYLTDDALVIFFDLYEIASYAEGIPSFRIPLEALDVIIYN